MSYRLKSPIASHFRSTANRWQTVAEIAEAMGKTQTHIRSAMGNLIKNQHLQRQEVGGRKQYRIKPESLNAVASPQLSAKEASRRLQIRTQQFCRKYRVDAPYQATRKSQSALKEWTEIVGGR